MCTTNFQCARVHIVHIDFTHWPQYSNKQSWTAQATVSMDRPIYEIENIWSLPINAYCRINININYDKTTTKPKRTAYILSILDVNDYIDRVELNEKLLQLNCKNWYSDRVNTIQS
jgi:hypothetical protein